MKKCSECNVDMIEELGIRADEELSIDNRFRLYITSNPKDYFGTRLSEEVKCRVCPKCGKLELYIDPKELNNN